MEDTKFVPWKVLSLDVWGNETGGFEVNDMCQVGTIELLADDSDAEEDIIDALQQAEYLNPKQPTSFYEIGQDSDDTWIYIDRADNGKPLLQLFKEI